jgi:hypothetical protein
MVLSFIALEDEAVCSEVPDPVRALSAVRAAVERAIARDIVPVAVGLQDGVHFGFESVSDSLELGGVAVGTETLAAEDVGEPASVAGFLKQVHVVAESV